MNNEDVRIDETSPVVYTVEVESRLYALIVDLIQIIFEVGTVFVDRPEEEHARVES